MKILAVCSQGEDRSVAFAYILKADKGMKDVLDCGIDVTTKNTFDMLADWADRIFVVGEDTLYRKVPQKYLYKTTHVDVGKDIWHDSRHPDLLRTLRVIINKLGL